MVSRVKISSAGELDALVGQHITGEIPEMRWQDSHGLFEFESELDALEAIQDVYYQRFLPAVDWSKTEIMSIETYRPYSCDLTCTIQVVEKMSAAGKPLFLMTDRGQWLASFGDDQPAMARDAAAAICVAALLSCGVDVQLERL
jgi:hypothetical protein